MNVDFPSFLMGFVFCMVSDCIFGLANFLLQVALDLRNKRKEDK